MRLAAWWSNLFPENADALVTIRMMIHIKDVKNLLIIGRHCWKSEILGFYLGMVTFESVLWLKRKEKFFKLLQREGRWRACHCRDQAVHICLPPGVAVSTPNKELFWHPNALFLPLPHLLPVENPQIATQHFKKMPSPSEKPSAGPARGFPSSKKRGGGPIMVINTSPSAEGIRVWACSAAYVDPAASVGGWFSSSAGCRSVIPLTEQCRSSGSQELFKNGSSVFCRKEEA